MIATARLCYSQAPIHGEVMTLASDEAPARRKMDTFGGLLGLLVFIAGIIMIIWTFTLVRGIFDGIDEK